jgi:2-polyprenyl-6-methoxyphenol hydroxylase-like FAD-dependent oxidoreductase
MSFTPTRNAADDRVLIVGGGIAGSLLALVLGRAGRAVTLFDPRRAPPPVFRNEKLGDAQIALLTKLGVLHCFESACWPPGAYPAEARPSLTDCGAPHQAWLASVRQAWPDTVRFVEATVDRLDASDDRQYVTTNTGECFDGRLAVLATGRMPQLRESLGVTCRTISAGHSVCLGFSATFERPAPAQVIHGPLGSGVSYVSLFPMPGETRVNVFSYRPLLDPWTRRMSRDPVGALSELDPAIATMLSGARVMRRCEARGTDLYAVNGHRRPGVVLIGDAFHAPCPASGTGMLRILNDIGVLARDHLPGWLSTPGMGRDKIAAFYADPVKRRLDQESLDSSLRGRGTVAGRSIYWRARRTLGQLKRRLQALPQPPRQPSPLGVVGARPIP